MPEMNLKPCPFCGREVTTKVSVIRGLTQDRIRFAVCCPACCIQQETDIVNHDTFIETEKSMRRAIEAWNRRDGNEID